MVLGRMATCMGMSSFHIKLDNIFKENISMESVYKALSNLKMVLNIKEVFFEIYFMEMALLRILAVESLLANGNKESQ